MRHFMLLIISFWGPATWAGVVENIDASGVILKGYDAVSYFSPSSKPQKGLAQYQVNKEGATYWFANDEDKQLFLKDPQKYQPQYGGWCAYAVADSKAKVDVDPLSYVIQDGRLLLFYNGLWGNTREKWLHSKNQDAAAFLKKADINWPEVKTKEP